MSKLMTVNDSSRAHCNAAVPMKPEPPVMQSRIEFKINTADSRIGGTRRYLSQYVPNCKIWKNEGLSTLGSGAIPRPEARVSRLLQLMMVALD